MTSTGRGTAAPLALAALALAACVSQPGPQAQAKLTRTAAYELQVEEGFGHLDRLPGNWAALPR
jgi:hypothetical protein